MRILFCDLQYSDRGSFDDDIRAIRSSIDWGQIDYYHDNVKASDLGKIRKLLAYVRKGRFDRVVFLSARLTVVFLLSFRIPDLHCIYHFLPNARKRLHSRLLRRLKGRVRFGVYGSGLLAKLEAEAGVQAVCVPSRRLDLERCAEAYARKAAQPGVTVLVPGVRPGVRDPVDLGRYLQGLRDRGIEVSRVLVQGDVSGSGGEVPVEKVPAYPDAAVYAGLFRDSTFVIMHFARDYELRCSGMVLDAVSQGCVVLTEPHPIIEQYGFPRFPICSLDTVGDRPTSEAKVREGLTGTSIVFENEFSRAWKRFLCG